MSTVEYKAEEKKNRHQRREEIAVERKKPQLEKIVRMQDARELSRDKHLEAIARRQYATHLRAVARRQAADGTTPPITKAREAMRAFFARRAAAKKAKAEKHARKMTVV